ncbi:penicillin-binding protein activator LpoB [Persicimonas caeni]|uniref:Penicillin-binding protein activator LpoB n=1 Tax=Persicimonas caeni TaxID=2292766 RepID=A0A4Y6PT07_PERCE|nr:penicillin-binding protein activator LpoB [Persicimonas caeni]QDG51456.1 penicillin-binding protein activator LpoB [Persicimonas caeni]QED32677.1 penicillin-binding protein activator LpoB [Persicimonas caeni]
MKSWKNPTRLVLLLLAAALALPLGCAKPQYVRDTEKEDMDEYTMSLRFDRKDLDRLYKDNIDKLLSSRITKMWERSAASGNAPVVAIFPMRNETSEHIGPQLDALLSKFETDLVNKSAADVVSHENQPELIAEIKRQQSDAYDPARLAGYGRQLGAQYFVTGKVYDTAERVEDERRVQYFMFVQVIDVETGAIKFQNESAISKGLMK